MSERYYTYERVRAALPGLGKYRISRALEIGSKGAPDGIAGTHLIAVGFVETGVVTGPECWNIVGDYGHGRGFLQLDDRYQTEWLRSHVGVKSGTWSSPGAYTALEPGRVPLATDAMWRAVSILRSARTYGRNRGVREEDLAKFMFDAYNAGPGGALAGYRDGDSAMYTTGGDYSDRVFEALGHVRRALKELGLA